MKLTFYGVRGSTAVPGQDTVRYGGNTTCIGITGGDGTQHIVDAGTGIRNLGIALGREAQERAGELPPIGIYFSHEHIDHTQGLPYFGQIYSPKAVIDVFVSDSRLKSTLQVLADQHSRADKPTEMRKKQSPAILSRDPESNHAKDLVERVMDKEENTYPLSIQDLPSTIRFHEVRKGEMVERGTVTATYKFFKTHPGGYTAWKFQEGDETIVVVTDYESDGYKATKTRGTFGPEDEKLIAFARGATVLVLDAQYSPEMYQRCIGWGHNETLHACELVKRIAPKTFCPTHYDPSSTDDQLDKSLQEMRVVLDGTSTRLVPAREGLEVSV